MTGLFFCLLLLLPSLLAFPRSPDIQAGFSDEELLETVQRQSFEYFIGERHPKTGLVRDRAHNFRKGAVPAAASIASTGFALTAYGVAVERGWMDAATAHHITHQTLKFFLERAEHERGFFYHFLNMETGERASRSEASPIDTALFLAGALFAAEYFNDPLIRDLAMKIYNRVDFPWMLHGGETLALAWSPEEGFNKYRWDHYDESMILYLLAIGSPTHPIPAKSWKVIRRPVGSYKGHRLIEMPPLFTHQYSHVWIDFRDKNDGFADYFKNSIEASLANRAFAIDQSSQYSTYGPNAWGLTASDGPFGYRAYGAPPGWALHDGTLAPTGCGSSIVFTPEESIACLRHYYEDLGDKLWGLYGFSDAFNLDKKWFDDEVIGIDQGALVLMIENYRSGLIWEVMSQNIPLQEAMKQVGFKSGTIDLPWPDPPEYRAAYVSGGMQVDSYLKDWTGGDLIQLDQSLIERGQVKDDKDLSGQIRLAWDEKALYFSAKVTDDDVLVRKSKGKIWLDDLLEIFIDPQGDGLYWYGAEDYQLGFRPSYEDDKVKVWSWFQGGEDPTESGMVVARGFVDQSGYVLEGAIRWSQLGVKPAPGTTFGISIALHDIDRDRSGGKLQWFFRDEEEFHRFVLGKVVLVKNE